MKMAREHINLDKFLTRIGEFGRYQRGHYFLLAMVGFFSCYTALTYVFVAAVPDHWCASPVQLGNMTLDERKALTLPLNEDGDGYSKCLIFDLGINDSLVYGAKNVSERNISRCSAWEYDDSVYGKTTVVEWNLVCGREWIAASIGACIGAGKLVFGIIGGILADRFGRKKLLVAMMGTQSVVGVLTAFSPVPTVFILGNGIISGASLAAYQCAFVIGVEMVGVKWRVFAGLGLYMFWSISYISLSLIAYFIRDWSTLQLVLHAPMVVFVGLYAWLTPESVRWLLQNDRVDEAVAILKNMAKTNHKEWDDSIIKQCEKTEKNEVPEEDTVSFLSLVKSRMMIIFTITSCFLWLACNLLFYGLSYNTTTLTGDPYTNFAISGAVEIPAIASVYFLLNSRLGRRGTIFTSLLIASVVLLATIPIPKESSIIATVLAMIGKFSSTAAFATIFIYTPEFYPTVFRSLGIGLSSFIGRIGVIIAPYVALLGTTHYQGLPLLVFGVASLAAAAISLILPETRLFHLPDTMEDLKQLKKHTLSCRDCCSSANQDNGHDAVGERDVMLMETEVNDNKLTKPTCA